MVGLGILLQVAGRFLVDAGPFDVNVNDGTREFSAVGGRLYWRRLMMSIFLFRRVAVGRGPVGTAR